MPWHELLIYLASIGDGPTTFDGVPQNEPAAAYRTPGVSIGTALGTRYVASWEGLELRGSDYWRKVRWNRVS